MCREEGGREREVERERERSRERERERCLLALHCSSSYGGAEVLVRENVNNVRVNGSCIDCELGLLHEDG